jgi:hypothetical protein
LEGVAQFTSIVAVPVPVVGGINGADPEFYIAGWMVLMCLVFLRKLIYKFKTKLPEMSL